MASPDTDVEMVKRKGFAHFAYIAWPYVPMENGYPTWERHMTEICNHLQAVIVAPEGLPEIRDLVINVPPGMSKSVITSVLWPVWTWIVKPHWKWIFTSYSEKLVIREADRAMRLIMSDWFQERWGRKMGLSIVDGMRASSSFYENTLGGMRYSVQMGGQVTGFHGHALVADDPHKVQETSKGGESAKNEVEKDCHDWNNTFSNRTADPSNFKRVVVMQRVHEADISQNMLDQGATHLCLPMEFEPERACTTLYGGDWRSAEGELLAPQRFPAHVVERKKTKEYTPAQYEAQCQQNPTPGQGLIFSSYMFAQRYFGIPAGLQRVILSLDCSFKDTKKSDFVIAQTWGQRNSDFFLLDQLRQRAGLWDTIKMLESARMKWATTSAILIEDKANGPGVIETVKKLVPGVIAVNPLGGKEARAYACQPYMHAMNCWFPDDSQAPWMRDYVKRMTGFPKARFDDEVDATSQALCYMTGQYQLVNFTNAMEALRRSNFRF